MLKELIGMAIASEVVSKVSTAVINARKNRQPAQSGEMLKVGISSAELVGMHYNEVIKILIGAGFRNIDAKFIRTYRNDRRGRNMFGKVKEVRIGGNSDFEEDDAFPAGSYVLVEFHVFVDTPAFSIPALEELKKEHDMEQQKNSPRVCPYCDCLVEPSSTSCPHCGAAVK